MVKTKDNVVRMEAPVIMVPDEQDREIPVLMNRHYIEWIMEHAKRKKLSIQGYQLKGKNIEITFKNPKHASVFALTWKENE
jgi:desulfoferrodoxin (superoxide reductase-like protein)